MRKIAFICTLLLSVVAWADQVTTGQWTLNINTNNGETDIIHAGTTLVSKNRAVFYIESTQYDQALMTYKSVNQKAITDDFGNGLEVCVSAEKDGITASIYYYLYENKPYILTQLKIVSANAIKSNFMAPVYSTASVSFLPASDNRNLFVPWDNDEWVRYNSAAFGGELTSNEVTALYNSNTNEALIIGSLEHTVWKSGIKAVTQASGTITELQAYGGLSNQWTRDILPHGAIVGTTLTSPKMMIGHFSDWRDGLETYADLNAIVAPKLPWKEGRPFIWNSWGVLQTKINYNNASENAEWIANNLPEYNNGVAYIDLDSYWTNLSTSRLKQFAYFCHERGQKAGIYWTPFVDWSNTADRQVEGAMQYRYSEIWLRANGEPIKRTGAMACDPTHPATRARIVHYMNNFKTWGFDFVKLDFMDHGALQADNYYDKSVTTAMQAYAQGMAYLDSLAGDMYLNLSIAPLFPAQFAHGRRIACDAYASISDSEYTLNSTSFGWWLDHVYSYNDGDNIVLKGQTEGANKIRLLSGVITGMLSIGDDFSSGGDETAKNRAITLFNNKAVMQCARQAKAFRPLKSPTGTAAADAFYTIVEDTTYVAAINWQAHNASFTVDYEMLGLQKTIDYRVEELWSGSASDLQPGMQLKVNKANCIMLKIYPKSEATVDERTVLDAKVTKVLQNGMIYIQRQQQLFTLLGQPL